MNHSTSRILLAAGILLSLSHGAYAAPPTDIQMLPPVDFSNNPCAGGQTGILYWDGTTAIKCVPGTVGDASGNVGIGTTTPQAPLDVNGPIRATDNSTACSNTNGGAVRYNTTTNVSEGCVLNNDSGVWSWLPLGGVHIFSTSMMPESSWNALVQDFSLVDPGADVQSCDTAVNHQSLLGTPGLNAYNPGCQIIVCAEYFFAFSGTYINWRTNLPALSQITSSCGGPSCPGGQSQVTLSCLYYGAL
jgi:hypothetical protein